MYKIELWNTTQIENDDEAYLKVDQELTEILAEQIQSTLIHYDPETTTAEVFEYVGLTIGHARLIQNYFDDEDQVDVLGINNLVLRCLEDKKVLQQWLNNEIDEADADSKAWALRDIRNQLYDEYGCVLMVDEYIQYLTEKYSGNRIFTMFSGPRSTVDHKLVDLGFWMYHDVKEHINKNK